MSACPASSAGHAFEADGDDDRNWVACTECGAAPRITDRPRRSVAWRPKRTPAPIVPPDPWSIWA